MSLAPPRWALLLLPAMATGMLVLASWIGPVSATETRYCAMGREMLASGDWVVPTLNGAPLLEKPPFEYWSTAAAMAVLGVNDGAPHVPHILAGALVLWIVAVMARRLSPEGAASDAARARGRLAALVLGTMPAFLVQAYAVTLDIYLVLSVVLAGWALLEADRAPGKPPRRWSLLLYAAFGLGMLVKGPLTLALVLGAAVVTAIARRSARILRPLASPLGLGLFVAITLPWYALLEQRMPGILSELVRRRLFGGLASSADFHGRGWRPWVAWGPLAGTFPWLAAVPAAILSMRAGDRFRRGPGLLLLALALAAPVLFTFSKTALVAYAAPAFPFLALLVALTLPVGDGDVMPAGSSPPRVLVHLRRATIGIAIAAVLVAHTVIPPNRWHPSAAELRDVAKVIAGVLAFLVAAVAVAVSLRQRGAETAVSTIRRGAVCSALFLSVGVISVASAPERVGAAKGLYRALDQHRAPGEPVAVYLNYNGDFGLLPWYLRAELPFFDYESKPMIVRPEEHRPDLFRPKADLVPWLKEPGRRWLMLRPRDRVRLNEQDVALTTVAEVGEYELVATVKPDAPRGPR